MVKAVSHVDPEPAPIETDLKSRQSVKYVPQQTYRTISSSARLLSIKLLPKAQRSVSLKGKFQELVADRACPVKVLFLPEAADYIGGSPDESYNLCKSVTESPFVLGLQEEAKKNNLCINVGIHEPSEAPKKIKNTLIWIDENGQITQRYQKLHMFDMELDDGPTMKESDTVEPGNSILPPFDSPVGRIGSCICFDLRFPELALALKRQEIDVLCYPSAFAPDTGKYHWHALLKARAIETQSYVLAPAQVGPHNKKRSSYGHSLIIDPWGRILAELGSQEDFKNKGDSWEPELATAEIDHDLIAKIKKGVPLHRRT